MPLLKKHARVLDWKIGIYVLLVACLGTTSRGQITLFTDFNSSTAGLGGVLPDGQGFVWDTTFGDNWTPDPTGNIPTTAWTNTSPSANAVLGTGPGNGSGDYTAFILFSDISVGTISSQNGNWTVSLGGHNLTLDSSTDSILGANVVGTGSLIKSGASILTISTLTNYTGGTTINSGTLRFTGAGNTVGPVTINSGGTLQIGVTDAFATATPLSLVGGTLQISGGAFSQNFGGAPLNVVSNSTVDFGLGIGSSSIVFADSHTQNWTGILTVSNYSVGDSLRFGNGSSALSSFQLLSIKFDGVDAQIDPQGFVTPVPEPSTYAACAGVFVFALSVYRRRRHADRSPMTVSE